MFAWKSVEDIELFCAPGAVQCEADTGEQLEDVSPYTVNKQLGWDGLQFYSQKKLHAYAN